MLFGEEDFKPGKVNGRGKVFIDFYYERIESVFSKH